MPRLGVGFLCGGVRLHVHPDRPLACFERGDVLQVLNRVAVATRHLGELVVVPRDRLVERAQRAGDLRSERAEVLRVDERDAHPPLETLLDVDGRLDLAGEEVEESGGSEGVRTRVRREGAMSIQRCWVAGEYSEAPRWATRILSCLFRLKKRVASWQL